MQAELWETFTFIREGGAVSIGVAATLAIMSIGSWTIIVVKAIQARRLQRSSSRFLEGFWDGLRATAAGHDEVLVKRVRRDQGKGDSAKSEGPGLKQAGKLDHFNQSVENADNPFARIAIHGIHAAGYLDRHTKPEAAQHNQSHERIANALRRGIDHEAIQLETGLTLLASIGSLSPFVGLFGTVCGIYHALGGIAASGQTTIDKVVGPVGEALVMTAFGLAVAIPAVLAYNGLLRDNRLFMLLIESFADDLYSYLTTETPIISLETIDLLSVKKRPAVLL